jgi:Fe-S cluster assembly protein SufD
LVIGQFKKAKVFSQNLVSKYFGQGVQTNRNGFVSLNTALAEDGLFVHVPAGVSVKHPIEVLHITTNAKSERTMQHMRQMIIVEKGANVTVFETYANQSEADKTLVNIVNEFVVDENANLEYYKIQNENDQAVQINQTEVQQARDSVFFSTILTSGGALVRNDLNARVNASNCETHFNGLYLGENKSVIDNHTIVDHKFPHTFSSELYKGIMTDSSKAVFNGRIFVREDAQKTNAYQTNRNILLTEDATVNTKPQLEIWADDVRCSHGATTGQLDKNAIFYLRSRGLSKDDARKFLLKAFTAEVIDTIKDEQIAEHFDAVLQQKLKFA